MLLPRGKYRISHCTTGSYERCCPEVSIECYHAVQQAHMNAAAQRYRISHCTTGSYECCCPEVSIEYHHAVQQAHMNAAAQR